MWLATVVWLQLSLRCRCPSLWQTPCGPHHRSLNTRQSSHSFWMWVHTKWMGGGGLVFSPQHLIWSERSLTAPVCSSVISSEGTEKNQSLMSLSARRGRGEGVGVGVTEGIGVIKAYWNHTHKHTLSLTDKHCKQMKTAQAGFWRARGFVCLTVTPVLKEVIPGSDMR